MDIFAPNNKLEVQKYPPSIPYFRRMVGVV